MAKHENYQAQLIQQRRDRVAQLYIEGKSQHSIAETVGVSQTCIHNDLKAIRQQWLDSSVRNFDEAKAVELRKLENLEKEAYEAWEKSKDVATSRKKKTEKSRTLVNRGAGRPPTPRMVPTRENAEVNEQDRDGDPRFLAMIFECIKLRLKVIGALEQDKNVNVNISKLDWDAMYKRQDDLLRMDPVTQRLSIEQGKSPLTFEQLSTAICLPDKDVLSEPGIKTVTPTEVNHGQPSVPADPTEGRVSGGLPPDDPRREDV